ncbi:colicin [Escherichia coli]|uniref:colicin n=1 Tax=Escherichia coli TaxID=562 RepID=UPI00307A2C60
MSDPVRITNPGAESLGYDSDGHEIMAVDIYVNPPRVDVFHGTPPAWSSFGNKTIWGGNEWVDDSPTRSDIEMSTPRCLTVMGMRTISWTLRR